MPALLPPNPDRVATLTVAAIDDGGLCPNSRPRPRSASAATILQNIGTLIFASHKFAVDARREGCRCISILQAFRNEADAAKSCDLFFANKSIF